MFFFRPGRRIGFPGGRKTVPGNEIRKRREVSKPGTVFRRRRGFRSLHGDFADVSPRAVAFCEAVEDRQSRDAEKKIGRCTWAAAAGC